MLIPKCTDFIYTFFSVPETCFEQKLFYAQPDKKP